MMRWFFALLLSSCFSLAVAATKSSDDMDWPKQYTLANKQEITMFQPQVDAFKDGSLETTSAFKINRDSKEYYGTFVMKGKALVNKETGLVTLSDMKVSNVMLPVGGFDNKDLEAEIQRIFSGNQYQVSYQSLVKNHDVQVSEENRPPPEIKNDVPNFIYTTRPAILIMIAGDPVWGDSKGASEVKRVINTSALILHEDKKDYYVWALDKWFAAPQLTGPYKVSEAPSSKFVIIKDNLIKDKKVDPMNGKTADEKAIYPPGLNPAIIISTKPAELLQSDGEPQFQAVQTTSLLYMSNTPNSIFLDSNTQNYYVLVTGRWFTSKNLKSGPWSYVPGKELPGDFAKIPATSPVAEALVSVPGSVQSKEAQIVTKIPQMAQVPKDLKPTNIQCDGTQKWVSISGTSLKYAENCNTPIIQVTGRQFYAVQDGVWFTSVGGLGPWNVAVAVPNEIYAMPASSPVYYVTYVHVYGVSGNFVTVGYTPGYNGTFLSPDGTIVYGTGYVYPYYVSPYVWYPPPWTYGFGVGYGWGYSDGFFMGFAFGAFMWPWGWGGCCWRGNYVNIHVTNIYHNWGGSHRIITGAGGSGLVVNSVRNTNFVRARGSSEVYAGHNGEVFRRNPTGEWQRYQGPGTWNNVEKNNLGQLENLRQTRTSEPARMPTSGVQARPPEMGYHPEHLRGGGFRAGGGFHGGGVHR